MPKKRAFVRYTKSGEIVPGSLILTNGSYPDKSALWKEVTVDECCDSQQEECTQYTVDFNVNLDTLSFPFTSYTVALGGPTCNSASDGSRLDLNIMTQTPITSVEELIASLNQSANIFGEFSVYNNGSNNQLRLLTSCCLSSDLSTCMYIERIFFLP